MEPTTEEKLKMESEISSMNREFKYALENLKRIKADTAEMLATRDRITKEITEQDKALTQVINDISEQKLNWTMERQAQQDELSSHKSLAEEEITIRSAELDKQEKRINTVNEEVTAVRNETRQLELSLKRMNTELEAKQKEVERKQSELVNKENVFTTKRDEFKKNMVAIIKELENI